MPRDPACGMTVDKENSIKRMIGDRTYYFCNEACMETFKPNPKNISSHRRSKYMYEDSSICLRGK